MDRGAVRRRRRDLARRSRPLLRRPAEAVARRALRLAADRVAVFPRFRRGVPPWASLPSRPASRRGASTSSSPEPRRREPVQSRSPAAIGTLGPASGPDTKRARDLRRAPQGGDVDRPSLPALRLRRCARAEAIGESHVLGLAAQHVVDRGAGLAPSAGFAWPRSCGTRTRT